MSKDETSKDDKPKKKRKKRYVRTLVIGHDANGKAVRKFVYGKTKAEANNRYDELKAQYAKGYELSETTVYEYSKRWLKVYKGSSSETQQAHYKAKLANDILPVIGHMPMKAVRESHLIEILNKYKGKKKSTVDKIRQAIQLLFGDAAYDRVIEHNPAARLCEKMPDTTKEERKPLSLEEKKTALLVAKTHIRGPYILTMLYCGLRRGECVALTVDDVDFVKKKLNIDKAYSYDLTHKGSIKGTKAASMRNSNSMPGDEVGARIVPIPELLLPVLKEVCKSKKSEDLLFPQANGKQPTKSMIQGWWKSFARACHIASGATVYRNQIKLETSKFNPKYTGHNMRHTYATDLRSAGVTDEDRDEFMGHAPKGVGLTYAKMTETTFNRNARKINTFHKKQKYFNE